MRWFAAKPHDSQEIRTEKAAIFLVATCCSAAGIVWSSMYLAVFGWGLIASLPLIFSVLVGSALLLSHKTGNHRIAVQAQLACILGITWMIQWSVGGLQESGFVLAWGFAAPVGALFFTSARAAAGWFALFAVAVALTLVFDDALTAGGPTVSIETQRIFFGMNTLVSSFVVFLFAGYFVRTSAAESRRAESLLLNILPRAIAPRLKAGEVIADPYEDASVLFCDMVGSTPLFAHSTPAEAVARLNEVFSIFDRLIEEHGVEKIRTIGDNYMVAAGVPVRRPDHAEVLVALALAMNRSLDQLPGQEGPPIRFRFGIHSGPLIAGVIGTHKFQYDLWGDTVNTAARMESHGEVGRVHISDATHDRVKHRYRSLCRGTQEIKGKGSLVTWFVQGPFEGMGPVSPPPDGAA